MKHRVFCVSNYTHLIRVTVAIIFQLHLFFFAFHLCVSGWWIEIRYDMCHNAWLRSETIIFETKGCIKHYFVCAENRMTL
jgi:hypothetical protein